MALLAVMILGLIVSSSTGTVVQRSSGQQPKQPIANGASTESTTVSSDNGTSGGADAGGANGQAGDQTQTAGSAGGDQTQSAGDAGGMSAGATSGADNKGAGGKGGAAAGDKGGEQPDKCWPQQGFMMMKPASGCPDKKWETGSVTNYLYRNSTVPDGLVQGTADGSYLTMNYCGHTTTQSQDGCTPANTPKIFPPGSYCFYMYKLQPGLTISANCPAGFKWAWVAIDDVDNFNQASHAGHVPLGEFFSFSTVQYYCCRNDGDPNEEIVLPTQKSFVLFPTFAKKTCQKVKGMKATKSEVFYSTEDEDASSNGAPADPDFPPPEYSVDVAKGYWGRGLHIGICHYSKPTEKVSMKSSKRGSAAGGGKSPVCWPASDYGFFAPKTGCPSNQGDWNSATVQHWEKPGGKSHAPDYMDVVVDDQTVNINYCMHSAWQQRQDKKCTKQNTAKWMPGSYCFFNYNMSDTAIFDKSCPTGFSYNWWVVDDVDTDNRNNYTGAVPSGEYYNYATVYYACCRDDGSVNDTIVLPTDKPFALMATRTDRACQQVAGMKSSYDEIFFDSEDVDSDVVPEMKQPYIAIDYTIDSPKGPWGAGMHVKICYYTKA